MTCAQLPVEPLRVAPCRRVLLLAASMAWLSACANQREVVDECPGAVDSGTVAAAETSKLGPSVDSLLEALGGTWTVDADATDEVDTQEFEAELPAMDLPDVGMTFAAAGDGTWFEVTGPCDLYPEGYVAIEVPVTVEAASADGAFVFGGEAPMTLVGTTPDDAWIAAGELPVSVAPDDVVAAVEAQVGRAPVDLYMDLGLGDLSLMGAWLLGSDAGAQQRTTVWNAALRRVP